jgi:hypothetical protein
MVKRSNRTCISESNHSITAGEKEMKIASVYVYVRYKRSKATIARGEHKGRLQRIQIIPQSQDIQKIKIEIAKVVKVLEEKLDYYYVTVAARRPDRTLGYRVVIKKTEVGKHIAI